MGKLNYTRDGLYVERLTKTEIEETLAKARRQTAAFDFVSPDETQAEMVVTVEAPTKRIDEMTLADYQRGCAKVMR